MSHPVNDNWLENVRECLLELANDVLTFERALDGQSGHDLLQKFGEYPPHYVAELLLDALHEKHVQKKLQS